MALGDYDIAVEPFLNNNPVAGYQICDQELGATSYFGYEQRGGEWYIMQSVTAGALVTYRYFRGRRDYPTGWAARAGLAYGYYSDIF